MIVLNATQKGQILEFVNECKADGVKGDRLVPELQGFISAMSNQTKSQDLRELATDPKAIAQILKDIDRTERKPK